MPIRYICRIAGKPLVNASFRNLLVRYGNMEIGKFRRVQGKFFPLSNVCIINRSQAETIEMPVHLVSIRRFAPTQPAFTTPSNSEKEKN